jgi:hypothetical protein
MEKIYLFVTNQENFKLDFPENGNSNRKSHSEIHKKIYKELINSLANNSIPVMINEDYNDNGLACFQFA